MKLRIKEGFWGVNTVDGKVTRRRTDEVTVEAAVGAEVRLPKGRRQFTVDEVGEVSVTVSVRYKNAEYDETWVIGVGESVHYRPISFDGGYYYDISCE